MTGGSAAGDDGYAYDSGRKLASGIRPGKEAQSYASNGRYAVAAAYKAAFLFLVSSSRCLWCVLRAAARLTWAFVCWKRLVTLRPLTTSSASLLYTHVAGYPLEPNPSPLRY